MTPTPTVASSTPKPTIATPPPCSSYTTLVTAAFGPDDSGTTRVFAAYENATSSPVFSRHHVVDGFPALSLHRIEDASGTYFSLSPLQRAEHDAVRDWLLGYDESPWCSVMLPTASPQVQPTPVFALPIPTPTPAPPEPLPPTTATIPTPCSSYTLLVTAAFGPDVSGTTRVFAAYEDVTSSPMFFRQHALSRTFMLACVNAIIARLRRHCRHGSQLRQIRIDPSHPDFDNPTVRTFSAERGVAFIPYSQPYETHHHLSFLQPHFAKANTLSYSDNRALEYCFAAHAALFDPSFTNAAYGRLTEAAHALLSLGSNLYDSGATFPFPYLIYRFQFTTEYLPDTSYPYDTYVPSDPAYDILHMYMNKLALSRHPDRRTRPHPFIPIPSSKPLTSPHPSPPVSLTSLKPHAPKPISLSFTFSPLPTASVSVLHQLPDPF